jgi:hypothetical protein
MVINSIKLKEKPPHIKITNRFIEDQQTRAIKDQKHNQINKRYLGTNNQSQRTSLRTIGRGKASS